MELQYEPIKFHKVMLVKESKTPYNLQNYGTNLPSKYCPWWECSIWNKSDSTEPGLWLQLSGLIEDDYSKVWKTTHPYYMSQNLLLDTSRKSWFISRVSKVAEVLCISNSADRTVPPVSQQKCNVIEDTVFSQCHIQHAAVLSEVRCLTE